MTLQGYLTSTWFCWRVDGLFCQWSSYSGGSLCLREAELLIFVSTFALRSCSLSFPHDLDGPKLWGLTAAASVTSRALQCKRSWPKSLFTPRTLALFFFFFFFYHHPLPSVSTTAVAIAMKHARNVLDLTFALSLISI